MKKLLLVATAAVALTAAGSAGAADLARPVYKAAPPPVIYSWTGCYVAGGGGYGMWNQDVTEFGVGGVAFTANQTNGGRGWFGTVQVGCDYQINSNWVIGAFADYDFSNIKGDANLGFPFVGEEKERSAWAVGGRVGWLPMEKLLTYVAAGYTQARFDQVNLFSQILGVGPVGLFVDRHTYSGWFVGTGYEYALGWLPGLFWKTEYRYADYRTDTVPILVTATGLPSGLSLDSHKYIQTVRSELVWRFNWGGGVVAKY